MTNLLNQYGWERLGTLEDAVCKVVADHYGRPYRSISQETDLRADLGADYIDIFEVLMTLEELFGVYFESRPAEEVNTVGDIVGLVRIVQRGPAARLASPLASTELGRTRQGGGA